MKYYVTADIHSYYSLLTAALTDAGYFEDTEMHKLIILGDLFDRGEEAEEMQAFVTDMLEKDEIILIRGNHEDLFEELVTVDEGLPYRHHFHNRTYRTAMQLTGFSLSEAMDRNKEFADAAKETQYFKKIIPAMRNWYETEHYIFVHGWIPCRNEDGEYSPVANWRSASEQEWKESRWYNGMDAVQTVREEKTIVCGHFHCSYGHAKYENKGSDFDPDADFSPYLAPGIIALDACTAHSGTVNCIVIND